MTTPATQAKQQPYGAPYGRQQTGGVKSPHQIYVRPHKKYSQAFFIALIIGVASTIGFVGVVLALLLKG